MRFLVDECAGPKVAKWLRDNGHDAVSVFDEFRGIPDEDILAKAVETNSILITNDKDFGEMIFRERREHLRCRVLEARRREVRQQNSGDPPTAE